MSDFNERVIKIVCSAALQSWRVTGLGPDTRHTELQPTKSAITGLIANALGYNRGDVRIDILHNNYELYLDKSESGINDKLKGNMPACIPQIISDYQTVRASGMPTAGGGSLDTASERDKEYIAGHRYILYIKASPEVITLISNALQNPERDLYLGSKVCCPAEDIFQGMQEIKGLEDSYAYQHIRN